MRRSVSAVVVSYDDPAAAREAVAGLVAQTARPDELWLVDNNPGAEPASGYEGLDDTVRVLRPAANLGFAGGVALAADQASGDFLFLLNPDALPDRDCLARLLRTAEESDADVVGAQILLPDGETTNAGENPVHITGLCWSGGWGGPREAGPPRPVASVSGAAMLIRMSAWRRTGGFQPRYFMYHEDVDLCWRVRLTGGDVVFCPEATVRHDYTFDRGSRKWFFLERNRVWGVLANFALPTLLLLAPLLAATEVMIVLRAAREGWLPAKVRAWREIARSRGELRAWRRQVQGARTVPDRVILGLMTGRFDPALAESRPVALLNPVMVAYRHMLMAVLR